MKWLLNMNMPRSLKQLLESVGHQCRHTGEIGLERASDWVVLEEAAREGEAILTHDLNYGRLLAFSGASKPSVVVVRLSRPTPNQLRTEVRSMKFGDLRHQQPTMPLALASG